MGVLLMGRLLMRVERRRQTTDAQHESNIWDKVRDEWFDLRSASGREQNTSGQMELLISHTGESTYFEGATGELRLTWADRVFNVESVQNKGEANRKLIWKLVEQQ